MRRAPEGYHELFLEHLAAPLAPLGFKLLGKSLLLEDDELRVAVKRTDSRADWPFQYTLLVSHRCVRDFEDRFAPAPSEPEQWPIKARPTDAAKLAKKFRYDSHLGWPWPHDAMTEGRLERQFAAMTAALLEGVPRFREAIAPAIVLDELRRRHTDAWCEHHWIGAYEAALRS